MLEAESRQTFDPIEKVVNLAKLQCTDTKHNSRIVMPRGMKCEKEAIVELKRLELTKVWKQFFREHTDEKGRHKTNLSPAQLRGLISLLLEESSQVR